jgi:hypothetical protein
MRCGLFARTLLFSLPKVLISERLGLFNDQPGFSGRHIMM